MSCNLRRDRANPSSAEHVDIYVHPGSKQMDLEHESKLKIEREKEKKPMIPPVV